MQSLPIDCEAYYLPDFLKPEESEALYAEIVDGYDVTNKRIKMVDGSDYVAETGTYFFVDADLTSYEALPEAWGGRSPWPDSLASVRDRIEQKTGVRFQVARSVYYRNGSEGMAFHSDPPAYGSTASIASLSLGAEREFVFRSIVDQEDTWRIILRSGSLLFMGEHCQERYEHSLPRDESCSEPRINLTFRKYGWK